MLEIMVVLVIAGLLLGVTLERGPLHSDALTFAAARSRVIDTLRDAQALSETSGDAVSVEVDAQTEQLLTVHGTASHLQRLTGPARMFLPKRGGGFLPRALYRFSADGSASGPSLVIMFGRHLCLIRLSAVTGRIETNET
ncbi:hypothetical protein KUA11_05950 [Acetobacter estunensis]|nr:hypothetical protein [Acetobacter estunensis]